MCIHNKIIIRLNLENAHYHWILIIFSSTCYNKGQRTTQGYNVAYCFVHM